jgi:Arf-GAP with SH3 domain, ANK repeat and PH domain-containing protein
VAGPPPASQDTTINGLTFVFASNNKDLDTLVTREFHADPNLHRNSNVELVGPEFSTGGSPSVQLDYVWKWRPPKDQEDKGGGWRNSCTFVEYDQRAHRLNTLATFAFWVQNTRNTASPNVPPPQYDLLSPPRIRVASSHSVQTVMSDSEGPSEKELPSPPATSESVQTVTQTSSPSIIDVLCPKPGEDFSAFEDGPVFRSAMREFEQKTGSMRVRMKKVLKKAEAAQLAQVQYNDAMNQFMDALREASVSTTKSLQPAIDHYFEKIAKQISNYETQNSINLQKLVIDPMSKLYQTDIKKAENKKRDFEEESKEYYAYTKQYLGQRTDSLKEKKRAESDSKYQAKRRNFELKIFDYSSFMQDLHGGRKEQEVISHMTKFADSQTKSYLATAKKIEELLPQLQVLIREVNNVDKEYQIQRTEREEKRRNIEKNAKGLSEPEVVPPLPPTTAAGPTASTNGSSYVSDSELTRAESIAGRSNLHHSGSVASQASVAAATTTGGLTPSSSIRSTGGSPVGSPGQDRFKGIRDLEDKGQPHINGSEQTVGPQRKEGLLWALSRPGSHVDPRGLNKTAWHK